MLDAVEVEAIIVFGLSGPSLGVPAYEPVNAKNGNKSKRYFKVFIEFPLCI
jgi:hypothetical protein